MRADRAILPLGLAFLVGMALPAAAKPFHVLDTRITCRSLAGISGTVANITQGDRDGHHNHLEGDTDRVIDRIIVVDLSDRDGYPVARLRYRQPGGTLVDPRDRGATVHVRYVDATRNALSIEIEYQSAREKYLFTRDSRGASLRLTRTRFITNGWRSSIYSGDCAVG